MLKLKLKIKIKPRSGVHSDYAALLFHTSDDMYRWLNSAGHPDTPDVAFENSVDIVRPGIICEMDRTYLRPLTGKHYAVKVYDTPRSFDSLYLQMEYTAWVIREDLFEYVI